MWSNFSMFWQFLISYCILESRSKWKVLDIFLQHWFLEFCVQISVVPFLFFQFQGSYSVIICTLVQHVQQRNQNMSNTQVYKTCAQWKVVFLYPPTYLPIGIYPKHNKFWKICINSCCGSDPIIHEDFNISVRKHWEEHKKTWHITKYIKQQ